MRNSLQLRSLYHYLSFQLSCPKETPSTLFLKQLPGLEFVSKGCQAQPSWGRLVSANVTALGPAPVGRTAGGDWPFPGLADRRGKGWLEGKYVLLLRPESKAYSSTSLSFCGETCEAAPGRAPDESGPLPFLLRPVGSSQQVHLAHRPPPCPLLTRGAVGNLIAS